MQRHWGTTILAAGLLGAALGGFGCGSGSSSASLGSGGSGPVTTASLAGRLATSENISLAGAEVVAEDVIGGRTATMRAILNAPDPARREALMNAVKARGGMQIPGVFTTTALADGSFVFPNLPVGEYTVTARQGDLVGVLTRQQVGGARTAATSPVHLAQVGTIRGKVRYAQPEVTTPDNSGILVFVKDTRFFGFTQGSSGDYAIEGVTTQPANATPYTLVAVAGGFADTETPLFQPFTGASATAPLIFMQLGATLTGRVLDPSNTDPDRQALNDARIVAITGQSAESNPDGFFILRGLPEGSSFLTITRTNFRTIRQEIGGLAGGKTIHINIPMQRR